MGLNFTPFLSYPEIKKTAPDLIDDAFGFGAEFGDVICLLDDFDYSPAEAMAERLINSIRLQNINYGAAEVR